MLIFGSLARRPYHFVPPPIPFSSLPESPPTPTPQLSSDTRLDTCPRPSPSTSNDATKKLVFVFETPDGYDYDRPIPFSHLEKVGTAELFSIYASKSGVSIVSLTKLTVSTGFGKPQTFAVDRYAESDWNANQNRIKALFLLQQRKEPTLTAFELLVAVD